MAYLKTAAIYTRLSEIVNDGLGSVRLVDAARFADGIFEGQGADRESFRGAQIQKPSEITIRPRRHPQRFSIVGSVQVWALDIEIRIVRTLAYEARVNDATRRAIKALVLEDADVLTQALEWSPNLATTSGGVSTDLKGIVYEKTRNVVVGVEGKTMTINAWHAFTGTAVSRPATS